MPQIIVRAYTPDGLVGPVTLAERAVPTEQHNDHYIDHLIERIGWALIDAEHLESQLEHPPACGPPRAKTQSASGSAGLSAASRTRRESAHRGSPLRRN